MNKLHLPFDVLKEAQQRPPLGVCFDVDKVVDNVLLLSRIEEWTGVIIKHLKMMF